MRKDCERACDDLVLAAGTRASAYAAHLLSIIRSLRLSHQRALPAVAMARRSYWDGRMRAILDPGGTISFFPKTPTPDTARHEEIMRKLDELSAQVAALR